MLTKSKFPFIDKLIKKYGKKKLFSASESRNSIFGYGERPEIDEWNSVLEKMVEIPLYIDSYIKLLTDIDKLYDKLETDKLQIDTARQTLSIIKLIETSYVTIKSLRLEFKQTILQSEFLLDD